ncbi:tRNA (adenosine(37)-N6)-dimethylallyltransferase MiaA [Candidatus Fermentibacteria bacterium]|nr:tRNA (adenosine(37)-N6)-dimethylallyltransferase MiaA [Candidatus Fermentibacteria bacterium]
MAAETAVPVLVGPTASGKTEAVIALARASEGIEVVSADSRQIYRGMDIGTAKPTPEQRRLVPHHLLDVVKPDQTYSAGAFVSKAEKAVEEIRARGGIPVVVGGSALYVRALLGGLDDLPERREELRKALSDLQRRKTGVLRRFLQRLDPVRAGEIAENDTVRLTRSLEIILCSGYPASEQMTGGVDRASDYVLVGIRIPRKTLRRRIERRTESMIEEGFLDEVNNLLKKGYDSDSILGRTIGYAECVEFLKDGVSLERTKERISSRTWQYARRQIGMFDRMPGISWWDGGSIHDLREMLFSRRAER